jgi:hypothetical protein
MAVSILPYDDPQSQDHLHHVKIDVICCWVGWMSQVRSPSGLSLFFILCFIFYILYFSFLVSRFSHHGHGQNYSLVKGMV